LVICSSRSALTDTGHTTSTRATPRSSLRSAQAATPAPSCRGHLVPEQRALSERQMQHAVDLVRIEGQLERGEGTTATTAS